MKGDSMRKFRSEKGGTKKTKQDEVIEVKSNRNWRFRPTPSYGYFG